MFLQCTQCTERQLNIVADVINLRFEMMHFGGPCLMCNLKRPPRKYPHGVTARPVSSYALHQAEDELSFIELEENRQPQ